MNYLASYRFLFRSPKWMQNLLVVLLVLFIAGFLPILPVMVLVGYQFEIIEALHLRGQESYPDFDFNRLMPYLMRGVWPVLVALVVSLPFGFLIAVGIVVPYFGLIFSLIGAGSQGGGSSVWPIIWGVVMVGVLLVAIVVSIFLGLLLIPMTLRAGLMRDFGAGFSWEFIRDFNRRVWKEVLLTEVFLIAASIVLELVGLLCFIVGVFVAQGWGVFARTYLLYELYEEYLKRGGTEIPLQVQAASAAQTFPDDEN
jgi:hypothetical protein